MKLIEKHKYSNSIWYYYEEGIAKRVCNDGEIWWLKNNIDNIYNYFRHKEDGSAQKNCLLCRKRKPHLFLNKYNRHFYLNSIVLFQKEFADLTNHKICLSCNDFCNQECFIEEI